MNLKCKHPLRICLCLLLALNFSTLAFANQIQQARFNQAGDTSRLVLEFESEPTFTYFTLSGPNRLVLDLSGVGKRYSFDNLQLSSKAVTKVRHSTPKTKQDTRLVIEMSKQLTPTIFTLPASPDASYRLVIELVDPTYIADTTPVNTAGPDRDKDIIIVVDAGHGGVDPGSIGPAGTYEKRITLSIAKMLETKINNEPGMRAIMTRDGDYYISPNARPRIAVQANADLLISIHADAFTTPQPRGGSVWVLSKGRADSELGRLLEQTERSSELLGPAAEVIEDRDTERYFAETILNMSMDLFRASSYELSNKMINEMKGVTKMHKKVPQSASLAVLTAPETPSILVEVGFISNPQEEKNLNWKEHRERLADAMFRSITAFFKKTPPDGTLWAQWKQNAPQQHRVASGESLSLLAQRYGVTVSKLKSENNLSSDMVKIGQLLTIPSS
ncbi:N-acetylmuramoyl-L-alanine amidase [Glaciecola sp. SC05]|uniref:N-acetylmuramoyl-L-alanine amidase n=1 Tax=Glaciecola sp. SC05 TaxID=1987355 RepID=UPI0035297D8A